MSEDEKYKNAAESVQSYWIIVFFACALAIFTVFYVSENFSEELRQLVRFSEISPESGSSQTQERFWIELDFGNGKKRLFEIKPDHQGYPLEPALVTTSEYGDFTVELRSDGTIASIDGLQGKWGVYQNGRKVSDSVSILFATGGERFVIKRQP